ncbi:Ubiquitin-fold modifier-conjugating enzyme 1 [Chelonia mydas]|uniref:Ubiquitin-fold modifier-conjugating enzyme 1 n=1 Tax=Chelonia mydas TaxID=8469 RepID=M7B278_CHEMY|nr:Ubiquitin-fold modifier-conjugating enzyme 1 [Chelonia mydas]
MRDAETPSSSLSDVFSQYFQTVSEYLGKQLPEKVKAEEIKTQAKAYLEQANEQFSPIAKRLHTEFMDLLTQLVETGKKAVQQWFGKCWYIHDLLKYEFALEFDIPVTYPSTAPEIAIPELDGKTAKMYRGGKICLTDHFKPLWARNVPKFGLAHLMALGLGPWLAVEIPDLIAKGLIEHKEK